MTASPERREDAVEATIDGVAVRAGFRLLTDDPLAGGPIEIEFSVETASVTPVQLAVAGDRARGRPSQFAFTATFEGQTIADPLAGAPDLGGPITTVTVSRESPWRQALVLNQFLELESTRKALADGERGLLQLGCRRPLTLAIDAATAMTRREPPEAAVDLAIALRRDDAALDRLVADLFDQVMHGPLAAREHPLSLLLALRAVARNQIEVLTRHSDPNVAARARTALG